MALLDMAFTLQMDRSC